MNIAVVGMGLMGASLAKAVLKYTPHKIFACDINGDTLRAAKESGACSEILSDDNSGDVDIIVFALRPRAAIAEMRKLCPKLKDGALVFDLCGNKRILADEMYALKRRFGALRFCGAHPMAGKERGGIANSDAELFRDCFVVLTPIDGDIASAKEVENLFLRIGARGAKFATPKEHDEMIAYTSQLAHVLSNCYVQNPLALKHKGFSAGSFQDLTRVARLDPEMWTELFSENSDNLSSCIEDLIKRLSEFKDLLESGDNDAMKKSLEYGVECKARTEDNK